jgi:hypothetical protein
MIDFCKGESYKGVVNLQMKKTFILVIMNEEIQSFIIVVAWKR